MAKRLKIESLHMVISSFGSVCGVGLDSPSAWRDAVERSGMHNNWKDMAFAGYACVEGTGNATYEQAALEESREAYRRMRAEHYGEAL